MLLIREALKCNKNGHFERRKGTQSCLQETRDQCVFSDGLKNTSEAQYRMRSFSRKNDLLKAPGQAIRDSFENGYQGGVRLL